MITRFLAGFECLRPNYIADAVACEDDGASQLLFRVAWGVVVLVTSRSRYDGSDGMWWWVGWSIHTSDVRADNRQTHAETQALEIAEP